MVSCQICQHENPEGAEYCENCGAALATAVATPAATPPSPVPTPSPPDASAVAPEVIDVSADARSAATAPTDASAADASQTSAGQTAPLPPDADHESPMASDVAADGGQASADSASAPAATVDAAPSPPQAATPAPASTGTGQNPRLLGVRYGAPTGDEHPLMGNRLVVGRFDSETGPVDIDLSQAPESEQISRQHAEVYKEADGRWFVKDLGSTNGVFVKTAGAATFGPRLTTPQALTNGDEIGFGNARFTFQTD